MKTFTYTIKDAQGIHARPAGCLVKLVKSLDGSNVIIEKGGKAVNATKLMMLMGLGIKCGDTVTFTVDGGDEDAAERAVLDFMNENL